MKILLKSIFLTSLMVFASIYANAQIEKKPEPKIVSVQMTRSLQNEIAKNAEMKEAIGGLRAEGDSISISTGKVSKLEGNAAGLEVRFPILTKVKNRKVEYEFLVYSKDNKGNVMVYFENKREVPKDNPVAEPAPSERLLKCGAWSPWYADGPTTCRANALCVGKNLEATYQKYTKVRQCKNSVDYKSRYLKINCGCP